MFYKNKNDIKFTVTESAGRNYAYKLVECECFVF